MGVTLDSQNENEEFKDGSTNEAFNMQSNYQLSSAQINSENIKGTKEVTD